MSAKRMRETAPRPVPGPTITVPTDPADADRLAAFTMRCGHVAIVLIGGEPGCNRDGCGWEGRAVESFALPLDGRESKCSTCGRVQPSDGKGLYRGPLPFLRLRWNYDPAAGRLDSHYCGCRGWD